jgi:hypothetical protein
MGKRPQTIIESLAGLRAMTMNARLARLGSLATDTAGKVVVLFPVDCTDMG